MSEPDYSELNRLKDLYYGGGVKRGKSKNDTDGIDIEYVHDPTRINQSNYLITINTNQVYRKGERDSEAYLARFDEVCQVFYENIALFLKVKPSNFPKKFNKKIYTLPTIEIGRKRKLIHTHANVEITHNSIIDFNLEKINKYFFDNMGLNKRCKILIKSYPAPKLTDKEKIESYIAKDVDGDYKYRTGKIPIKYSDE